MKVSFDGDTPTIEIALPVYDSEGNQVDTTSVQLSQIQIEDIINGAVNVVYATRRCRDLRKPALMISSQEIDELNEALESYSVIEGDEFYPGIEKYFNIETPLVPPVVKQETKNDKYDKLIILINEILENYDPKNRKSGERLFDFLKSEFSITDEVKNNFDLCVKEVKSVFQMKQYNYMPDSERLRKMSNVMVTFISLRYLMTMKEVMLAFCDGFRYLNSETKQLLAEVAKNKG